MKPGLEALKKVLDEGVFEGISFTIDHTPIEAGDTYLAGRNTGPHLLTCDFVKGDVIYPKEIAYPFDRWECVKIQFAT